MRIIEEQEATIQELRKENLAKDEEIAVLRRQLQAMIDQKTKCDIDSS
jgi:cell division protein FtsB